MTEHFLNTNILNSNIKSFQDNDSLNTSEIEDFRKRFQREREGNSPFLSSSGNEKKEVDSFLHSSPTLDLSGGIFSSSNIDDFSSSSTNSLQNNVSNNLFLPFMMSNSNELNSPQIPQRTHRAQSSPNIAEFLSRRSSPSTEQQSFQQQQQDSSYSTLSLSSLDSSLNQSTSQQSNGSSQLSNLPNLINLSNLSNLSNYHSSPFISQLAGSQSSQLPLSSQYPNFQSQSGGYAQGYNTQMHPFLFQGSPYISSGNEIYNMPAYGALNSQIPPNNLFPSQSYPPNLLNEINQNLSSLSLSIISDQQISGDEEAKKSKKPLLSLDNQPVYLYPRHLRMELTYTSLNNVHVRYGSFMSTPDVYFIARNHLKDLVVVNPYIDDYYYIIYATKQTRSVPPELLKWIKKSIEERSNPPEKEQPPQFESRLFGRISGISPKNPRVQVDDVVSQPLPQDSVLNKDNIKLKCGIEDCFDNLLIIDDFVICSEEIDEQSLNISTEKSKEVTSFIQSNLLNIILLDKGLKLIDKALRVLIQDYSYIILESIFNNWDNINRNTNYFKTNSVLLTSLLRAIGKITNLSYISKLLVSLIQNSNSLILRILNPFYIQLLGMILKQAKDFSNVSNDEWKRVFSNLLFINMKQIGFSTIIEKHPEEISWMFLSSILIHSLPQQKSELLQQVKKYTEKQGAESNQLIAAFLKLAKEN